MKLFKSILNSLPFLAVFFAAFYFYRQELDISLQKPDFFLLSMSMILLFCVFCLRGILWHRILLKFNINVSIRDALDSQFRTILLKYIPGKFWILLGKANIISNHGHSLKLCSLIALFLQLLMVLSGFAVGVVGLIFSGFFEIASVLLYAAFFVCLGILVCISKGGRVPSLILKIFPERISSSLSARKLPSLLFFSAICVIQWLILGVAYVLFFYSIGFDAGYYPSLLQPLANNIGIIATFAPGGLGVREGVMIGYLYIAGLSVSGAATVSIAARIWFFFGECIIFIAGLAIHWQARRGEQKTE